MSIIGNIIDAFTGKKRWEDVTGGVLVSPTMGTAAGCSPSFIGYSSPNYVDFDPGKRVPIDGYVLVDDGDGTYDAEKDYWENLEGERVLASKDEKLRALLTGIGVDFQKLGNFNIPAFKNYWEVFSKETKALTAEKDDALVMEHYEKISEAGKGLGLGSEFESPLYGAVMAATGSMGCYIPLAMAEGFADKGKMEPMETCFSAAVHCSSDREVEGVNFNTRAADLRRVSYIARANAIVAEARNGLGPADMIAKFKQLGEAARQADLLDELSPILESVVVIAFEAVCEQILADETVKSESADGTVALLDTKLNEVDTAARGARISDSVSPMVEQTRRTGYFSALTGIQLNEARSGEYEEMNKKLDALVGGAKKYGIIADISTKLRNIRIMGYLRAIESVAQNEAKAGDVKGAEKKLDAIQNSARRYGVLNNIRKYISEARSDAKEQARKNAQK